MVARWHAGKGGGTGKRMPIKIMASTGLIHYFRPNSPGSRGAHVLCDVAVALRFYDYCSGFVVVVVVVLVPSSLFQDLALMPVFFGPPSLQCPSSALCCCFIPTIFVRHICIQIPFCPLRSFFAHSAARSFYSPYRILTVQPSQQCVRLPTGHSTYPLARIKCWRSVY